MATTPEEVRASAKRTLFIATLQLHAAAISLVYGQIRSGTITGSVKDATLRFLRELDDVKDYLPDRTVEMTDLV